MPLRFDEHRNGKSFQVRGAPGEKFTVTVQVAGGKVSLTLSSSSTGSKVFESGDGWNRHSYYVMGSFDKKSVPMVMDSPGVFRCTITTGGSFNEAYNRFVETFQVVVDEDPGVAFYPNLEAALCSECIIYGPDGGGDGKAFLLISENAGAVFDIVLDLTAEDRRNIVTWSASR